MLIWVPGSCAAAEAQPQATAFGDLWQHVKSGDTVFVMDGSGRETTGVFAKVSDSNLSFGAVGALIDHFIKGRTVVFRVRSTALRLRPDATVGRHGVSASLWFGRISRLP
jgi:hypothetical protein